MNQLRRKSSVRASAMLAGATLLLVGSVQVSALTTIWDGGGANSNWDTAANWNTNVIPPTTNDVEFATGFASGTTIETHGYRTVNSLIISTTSPFTIHGDDFGLTTLTLFNGNLTRTSTGTMTIQSAPNLGANGTWNIASNGIINVTGQIHEQFPGTSLTKTGAGTLTLGAGGSYSGGTFVNQGILQLQNTGAGTGLINLASGASLVLLGGAISNSLVLNGTGTSALSTLETNTAASSITGPVTLLSSIGINLHRDLEISGSIGDGAGSFGIFFGGSGQLTLSGSNFFDGPLSVGGRLVIASAQALGAAGISSVGGTGGIPATGGVVHVADNLTINRPLVLDGPGTLGLGALEGDSGANWSGPITMTADSAVRATNNFAISGNITSSGFKLKKLGGGTLNLSGNNSLDVSVEEGTLALRSTNAVGSATVEVGAAVEIPVSVNLSGSVTLKSSSSIDKAVLRVLAGNSTLSELSAGAGSAVFVASGALLSVGAVNGFSSTGELHKTGPGILILTGVTTPSGGTFIEAGTLSISDDSRLGLSPVYVNGGSLLFSASSTTLRDYPVNGGRLVVASGATVTFNGSNITGGFLLGPGIFSTTSSANLNGVTALAGSNINVSGPTFLNGFINGGNLSAPGATWNGGSNSSSGKITIGPGVLSTTAFSNDGVITINSLGILLNSGNPLTSGGGSRITINPGGAINLSGNPLELNGALLVNNGTITGTTNVNFGSLAKGAGVYGAVNVTDGGKFSPGNSPGSVITASATWNSGGGYLVEMGNFGSDFWQVNGRLDINASPAHPFTISLASIDGLIFDNTRDNTWPILHANDGLVDFDPSALAFDTSGFKNDLAGGQFSLQSTGNDLIVHFSAIPEPSAVIILLGGALFSVSRKRSKP